MRFLEIVVFDYKVLRVVGWLLLILLHLLYVLGCVNCSFNADLFSKVTVWMDGWYLGAYQLRGLCMATKKKIRANT